METFEVSPAPQKNSEGGKGQSGWVFHLTEPKTVTSEIDQFYPFSVSVDCSFSFSLAETNDNHFRRCLPIGDLQPCVKLAVSMGGEDAVRALMPCAVFFFWH